MKKLVEYWMPGESLVGFQTLMMMIRGFCPKVQRCPLNCGWIWQNTSTWPMHFQTIHYWVKSSFLCCLPECWSSWYGVLFVFDQHQKLTKSKAGCSEFTLSLTNAGMRLKELLIPTFSCFISNGCSYTAVIYQIRACCSTYMVLDFYPFWNTLQCRTQIAFCGNLWWPWRILKWDLKCT